jgi:N-methylhydantoinase B
VGDSLERDPEAVAKDVRWRLISHDAVESDYGVLLNEGDGVDAGATRARREEIKAERGELPNFDHGPLPSLDEQREVIAETRREFNEWLSGELGARQRAGG